MKAKQANKDKFYVYSSFEQFVCLFLSSSALTINKCTAKYWEIGDKEQMLLQ